MNRGIDLMPPRPARIRLKSNGREYDVFEHTLGDGILIGDEQQPVFVTPDEFEVITWEKPI